MNWNHIFVGVLFLMCSMSCDTAEESDDHQFVTIAIDYSTAIPIHEKTPMSLTESYDSESNFYVGKIERRGGFSIIFPKHSYEIDLNDDVSLSGLSPDDDWILNANYIDKTFLRHVQSFELFEEMGNHNTASDCVYVELELNGIYQGLYVLMEKLDQSSLDIDAADSISYIFKEPHVFRASYEGIKPQDEDNFHQQTYPKIVDVDKRDEIETIRQFILTSSDIEFNEMFAQIFDEDNIIDWHLLLLITNNSDGILKNFYLYKKDKNTPLRIAPWDYDHSFGRDGDNELNLDERIVDIERSILFKRLMKNDWYVDKLIARWQILNDNEILSKEGLQKRILTESADIRSLALKNFDLWPVDGEWYYDKHNFDEEIDIMIRFIDLRHNRLVQYFDEL